MSKSSKMYSKSPSIKKDEETGKVKISKPTEADGVDMGTEGNPLPTDGEGEMPVDIIQAEKDDVLKRHIEEHKQMSERHHDEFKAMIKRHSKVKE